MPSKDVVLPLTCTKIMFSGLFLFCDCQRKVRFPKGRPGAAASTDDIRAEDDKQDFPRWLFIFWCRAARITILSNKAVKLACLGIV